MTLAKPPRQPLPCEPLEHRPLGKAAVPFDDWARLDRLLVLGADAPVFHVNARELTAQNTPTLGRCYERDPERTVARILAAFSAGRASRTEALLFALAVGAASPHVETRRAALAALPAICLSAADLFYFVAAVRLLGRGWGRTLKRAVAEWYERLSADDLADQVCKCPARGEYSHRRLLQTAHPKTSDAAKAALFRWILYGTVDDLHLSDRIAAHRQAADPETWPARLQATSLPDLIRNLGRMSAAGGLAKQACLTDMIVARLSDAPELREARLHPISLLLARAAYRSGKAGRNGLTWKPETSIRKAIDHALHASFAHLRPSGKRLLIAIDVSESMTAKLAGSSLTADEAATVVAMAAARTEPHCQLLAFSDGLRKLKVRADDDLPAALRRMRGLGFGRTDCALPMMEAEEKGWAVDAFLVYTDNETWHGDIHPAAALAAYRAKTGIAAKLVVVGMTSTGFCLADPDDGGMLDVVGFDASAAEIIADFVSR